MERAKLYPEISQEHDKAFVSESKTLPGEAHPFIEFLSFYKERKRPNKAGGPNGNLDDTLKNESDLVKKSRKNRDELFDVFVEYWCTTRPMNLRSLISQVEKSVIIKILGKVNGNQKIASKALGMSPTTLNEKLKKYGIYFRKAPFVDR
jgi:DNA-binding NtrC family response regulator